MKKAGHGSVSSNPTEKCKIIFLASLKDFLSDYALKNEDAGNLPEKVSPYGCSTCNNLFLISTLLQTFKYVPQWL